jgi:hypothetical protein
MLEAAHELRQSLILPLLDIKDLERFCGLALIPGFPLSLNFLNPSYFLSVLGCYYPVGDLGLETTSATGTFCPRGCSHSQVVTAALWIMALPLLPEENSQNRH